MHVPLSSVAMGLWLHGAGQLGLRAAFVRCRVRRGVVFDWYRRPSHCDWHCVGVGSAFVVSTVFGVRLGWVRFGVWGYDLWCAWSRLGVCARSCNWDYLS